MIFVVIVQRNTGAAGDDERVTEVPTVQVSRNPERLTSKHVHLQSVIVLKAPEVLTGCLPPRSLRYLSSKDNKNTLDKNTSVGREELVMAPLTSRHLSRLTALGCILCAMLPPAVKNKQQTFG